MTSDLADYGAKAPPSKSKPTAPIFTPCSTACGLRSAAPRARRKRAPGFLSSPVIACAMSTASAASLPSSWSTGARACSELLGGVVAREVGGGGGEYGRERQEPRPQNRCTTARGATT